MYKTNTLRASPPAKVNETLMKMEFKLIVRLVLNELCQQSCICILYSCIVSNLHHPDAMVP